jgi:hypothetical protein
MTWMYCKTSRAGFVRLLLAESRADQSVGRAGTLSIDVLHAETRRVLARTTVRRKNDVTEAAEVLNGREDAGKERDQRLRTGKE